ncbi:immunity protein Imm33 domain-containing protein [Halomonas heilongjiangensis]|uniref:DUF2185 domain-containing protein n=1 Tax=Halomonas heilongjiangensis TaxID=1387883 RepID=A0A2N7TJB7_9GAMM|nr:DUF2185 domain-containing protein [Halomonas heilongjiangensis]PMR68286.1 DUF2185 domain-containing protein [Halomonas heilongjiangensis]PXX93136.1 hypothetical protein CR158_05480 [Halomonas heilongjiangensis]
MDNKSWVLEDAQKIADEFPYTFYKPSKEVVSNLQPGNQAKLIFQFESDDPEAPRAERMWVEIAEVTEHGLRGFLDNQPVYIKDLHHRDPVEFQECHIIDTDLDDPVPSITEKYIKRCFVTNNILYEGQSVGYLYREEPDYDDDSGWRFTTGTETDEYMDDSNNSSYVSLGAVLCIDDSFIQLLEREPGVAFVKDEGGNFVEV